ncbi:uncharacterized protein LOC134819518 [Bolinopsis microptera]|uniref:uncharacterized protein LOC134819518 n=1 Tax=Bolinopsis microptera TaxID=2820187 RepID=UPI00307AC4D5
MKNQLGSYPPPNLIDGNLQNFAHTLGAEDGMWIRINLEQCSLVTKVTVYNRHNCCTERIIGASIFIKAGNSYVKDCGKISSSKTSYTFNCEGTGNVIEISQEKKVGPWNLAEIQVYGTSSDSLCTDKPVLIAARSGGIYDMASLQPGNQITAWGVYQDGTSKFSVNIVAVPDRNINLLHVDFRFGVLVMNCKYGNWGREKRVNYNNKRFEAGKEFKVTIKVSADEYQVYLDDEEIGRYPAQRLNLANAVQLVGGSRGFKWTKLGLPSN